MIQLNSKTLAVAAIVAASPFAVSPISSLLVQPVLAQSGEVNLYTYREAKLIQPVLDAFTKDTGIKVNVVSASSGLEQRIKTEGAAAPAPAMAKH